MKLPFSGYLKEKKTEAPKPRDKTAAEFQQPCPAVPAWLGTVGLHRPQHQQELAEAAGAEQPPHPAPAGPGEPLNKEKHSTSSLYSSQTFQQLVSSLAHLAILCHHKLTLVYIN